MYSVLQIRSNKDNLGIVIHIFSIKTFCDTSLEPSLRDGSNEGSQHKLSLKNKRNKASQAIQSPRTVPFFLLVSLLDGYSFPNVLVKGIVAFKH